MAIIFALFSLIFLLHRVPCLYKYFKGLFRASLEIKLFLADVKIAFVRLLIQNFQFFFITIFYSLTRVLRTLVHKDPQYGR